MRKGLISGLILFVLLGAVFQTVLAQTYLFEVPKAQVTYYLNSDGTASVDYVYEFKNSAGADAIDAVDIGMPTSGYDLKSVKADVNGVQITSIEKSPYVTPGIAVNLGSKSIKPGATGKVHVYVGKISKVLYPDTEKEQEDYASFQFMPNYFDSKFVNNKTDLTVTLVLPPGLKSEEPRYYPPKGLPGDAAFSSQIDANNRVNYQWYTPNANSYSQYTFGGAFPARLVPKGTIQVAPAFTFDSGTVCCVGFGGLLAAILGIGIYGSTVSASKRKMQYLPPRIAIEGNGIKRGLTAVEAAVLMEQPLDKIHTMILFSVIKKGAAVVTNRDPLTLQIASPLPEGLYDYENSFLKAFATPELDKRRFALQAMSVALVRSLTEKMKGFSQKETVVYYKNIIETAWQQVQSANTPEVKSQKYDEVMDWTMADKNFETRTRDIFSSGPVFVPRWWGGFDPIYRHSHMPNMGSQGPSIPGGSISVPSLPGADFAASVVNSVSSYSAATIGNLTSFTDSITNVTNPPPPPPPPSRGGSSGGGGRSCACACACAGCACACAGGGR